MANSDQLSSKSQKLRRNRDQKGIDRLSNLPDHILLHILSLLPTETAAATSVLSKSWQFLWTLVLNLDFDQSRSHPTTVDPSFQLYQRYQDRTFANFVTRVLLRRRERFIRRFRLKCHEPYDPSDFELWVSSAIAHNVQELDLDLNDHNTEDKRFKFHITQQCCKTLVVLKLTTVLIATVDKLSFPLLKIFHLEDCELESGREIKFLPSGFPVLEELAFHLIYEIDTSLEIYLLRLRSLNLCGGYGLVRVDCPALTLLDVDNEISSEFHLENLLGLVEANIDAWPLEDGVTEEEMYGKSVVNVVKAISNVRIMRLSYSTMKGIGLASSDSSFSGDDIPFFHNVVQVELPFICSAWEIMILMLQKFENLECLTLFYQGVDDSGSNGKGVDTKKVIKKTRAPNCLTSHLITFSFRVFHGRGDQMNVTKYILKNSLVLKNMTIIFCSSLTSYDRRCIRRKLRKSHRGNRGVNLNFVKAKKINKDA